MSKLEILCGPIASGKSSYCRQRANEGAIIINDDAIVTALHGGNYALYTDTCKPLYKSVEMSILTHALSMGKDVIIDRPCCKKATRSRYIELARSLDVPVYGYKFKRCAPEVHAERRMKSDGRGHDLAYWVKVAKAHEEMFEEPTLDEGYTELVEK